MEADTVHWFYLADRYHLVELWVLLSLQQTQLVLERNHFREVHHAQGPAKAAETGSHSAFQNLYIQQMGRYKFRYLFCGDTVSNTCMQHE